MTELEFEEERQAYAQGKTSRRRFISRLVAGGVTVTAAMAFADATVAAKSPRSSTAAVYGSPAGLYGTPPGQGGTPPGQGGTPPPFADPPPGQGGTPPGQGGTPPGLYRSSKR